MNIAEEMREHLEKKLLPFWKGLKDQEHGGFYGFMEHRGMWMSRQSRAVF